MKQIGYKTFQLDEAPKHYAVVATKIGYAVQNTFTFHIVGVYENEREAKRICDKLNK